MYANGNASSINSFDTTKNLKEFTKYFGPLPVVPFIIKHLDRYKLDLQDHKDSTVIPETSNLTKALQKIPKKHFKILYELIKNANKEYVASLKHYILLVVSDIEDYLRKPNNSDTYWSIYNKKNNKIQPKLVINYFRRGQSLDVHIYQKNEFWLNLINYPTFKIDEIITETFLTQFLVWINIASILPKDLYNYIMQFFVEGNVTKGDAFLNLSYDEINTTLCTKCNKTII